MLGRGRASVVVRYILIKLGRLRCVLWRDVNDEPPAKGSNDLAMGGEADGLLGGGDRGVDCVP